jgi:CRISPR-associated protein Csx17
MGITKARPFEGAVRRTLQAIHLLGIQPDSLGDYFAGLGVLAAAAREWPQIRGCWTGNHFVLLGEGLNRERLETYLLVRWEPTLYEHWWVHAQKKDKKNDLNLQAARSAEELGRVKLLDSNIVGAGGRKNFNPIFGTGGNVGRRDLQVVSQHALAGRTDLRSLAWLGHTLHGEGSPELPELTSTGTWFVYANRTFNSGQSWYREGRISPWSFLLAMEGALLLRGGVGKRFGSNAKPYAVFPFVTDAASPMDAGQIGMAKDGEFWAPLWTSPASLLEVGGLLERGLARIGRRTAKSPHEFAIAALAAGVDTGISKFVRFSLRQTTSRNSFEAIPKSQIQVNRNGSLDSSLVQPLLEWMDRLPFDPRDQKQKARFQGLRGPAEECLIALAERPGDDAVWQEALLVLATMQNKIDKNGDLRDRCAAIPWLSDAWFEKAWPAPTPELELARAIASIGAGTEMPVQCNIFGVEVRNKGVHLVAKTRPQRAVWHSGEPVRVLADVLERRLTDIPTGSDLPLGGTRPCGICALQAFLSRNIDYEVVTRWIPPLSLIRWGPRSADPDRQTGPDGHQLYGLFRPLFHPQELRFDGKNLLSPKPLPRPVTARTLLKLIRQEAWSEALRLASDRYLAAGRSVVEMPADVRADGDLVAGALLIPVESGEVIRQLQRWLRPPKRNRN